MSNNKVLKIAIISLLSLLGLVIIGANNSFTSLRWSVLIASLIISGLCIVSRRYYWGSLFVFFTILFNPWIRPSLSRIEWIITDITLFISLILWSLDYFRSYHKGLLFERFIESRFSRHKYDLVRTTKDLSKKLRRFVESDVYPDFDFREKVTGKLFAVECKYRSDYYHSNSFRGKGILWKKDQGDRYLAYSQKNNIPTYIVIGIGGNPKNPKTIGQIPIEIIQKQYFNFIPKEIIEQYPLKSS